MADCARTSPTLIPPLRNTQYYIFFECGVIANSYVIDAANAITSNYLLRQGLSGPLAHHVLGVPVRPVLITLPAGALLVLAVGRRCTPKCAR